MTRFPFTKQLTRVSDPSGSILRIVGEIASEFPGYQGNGEHTAKVQLTLLPDGYIEVQTTRKEILQEVVVYCSGMGYL